MKADHRQPSARSQAIGQAAQRYLEPLKLVIYGNSQCLKSSRRRVDAIGMCARHRPANDRGQVCRRANRRLTTRFDDAAGNLTAITLLPVAVYQVGQVL